MSKIGKALGLLLMIIVTISLASILKAVIEAPSKEADRRRWEERINKHEKEILDRIATPAESIAPVRADRFDQIYSSPPQK